MLSTPPATTMSFSPAMMRCAAMAMVCRPLEQKRFTVMPLVVIGRPARSAICRAMLLPVAPSGVAQPMITSSTSAPSMPARSTAALTAWPPRVAPWVMLKAPFQLLASGVRAVETMTALVMNETPEGTRSRSRERVGVRVLAERLAFGRELGQERRRLPEASVVVRIGREALHRLHDVEEAHRVGVVH